MSKIPLPEQIINPFSENFMNDWNLWVQYKWVNHQFKYKSVISEQMAVKHLVELSDGMEEKAIKIINQSIRREWAGFFPLKETTNGKERQPKPTSTNSTKDKSGQPASNLRGRVSSAYDDRYGNKGFADDEPHLKAV